MACKRVLSPGNAVKHPCQTGNQPPALQGEMKNIHLEAIKQDGNHGELAGKHEPVLFPEAGKAAKKLFGPRGTPHEETGKRKKQQGAEDADLQKSFQILIVNADALRRRLFDHLGYRNLITDADSSEPMRARHLPTRFP